MNAYLIEDVDDDRGTKEENHEDVEDHVEDVVLVAFALDLAVDLVGDAEWGDAFAANVAYFDFFFFLARVQILPSMDIHR